MSVSTIEIKFEEICQLADIESCADKLNDPGVYLWACPWPKNQSSTWRIYYVGRAGQSIFRRHCDNNYKSHVKGLLNGRDKIAHIPDVWLETTGSLNLKFDSSNRNHSGRYITDLAFKAEVNSMARKNLEHFTIFAWNARNASPTNVSSGLPKLIEKVEASLIHFLDKPPDGWRVTDHNGNVFSLKNGAKYQLCNFQHQSVRIEEKIVFRDAEKFEDMPSSG